MKVTRRGLLGLLAGAGVVAANPELWTPTKTIFLPPRGGWVVPAGHPVLGRIAYLEGDATVILRMANLKRDMEAQIYELWPTNSRLGALATSHPITWCDDTGLAKPKHEWIELRLSTKERG